MPMVLRRPRTHRWTRADLARLPDDGNRYEVLDGVLLVTPQAAFGHQHVATRLCLALAAYCERNEIGTVVAPGAVPHGKSELQPDVQVVPGPLRFSADWTELPTPILVAEVLSPSTERRDLGIKRDAYLRWGVKDYWVIDLDERRAHVFGGERAETVVDVLRWKPRRGVEAFELRVSALFE